MQISPLTPGIGAEVQGIGIGATLEESEVEGIREALREHLVLVFRDEPLSLEALDAFGRRLGPPHIHPATPGAPGYPGLLPVHTDADSKTYAGSMWHSDVSCDAEPPMGSILHLHEVPETGGDTLFANMYSAYEALSDPMKQLLEGLSAVNASAHHFGGYFGYQGHEMSGNPFPESVHPVVRTHPVTGRKALYVNETFTTRIVELHPEESKAVLALLYRHLAAPRFQCRVRWRPGTTVMWDNRCTQHHAMWDYYPQTRSGHRYTIAGDRPR